MQEYFRASRLREVLDAAGFRCAAAACLGWFVFLWGLTPRALAAGAALFLLLTLLLGLYTLSGLMYYAVPGLICVGLASACRCVRSPEDSLLRG